MTAYAIPDVEVIDSEGYKDYVKLATESVKPLSICGRCEKLAEFIRICTGAHYGINTPERT